MFIVGPWCFITYYFSFILLAALSFAFGKNIHWSVGLAYFCTMFSAVKCMNGALYPLNSTTPLNLVYLQQLSAMAVLWPLFIYAVVNQYSLPILRAIAGIVVASDAILVIWQFLHTYDGYVSGGFLLNSSMNGAFIALGLPLIPFVFWPIGILAIFMSAASVPIAVLVAILVGYAITKTHRKTTLALGLACVGLAFLLTPQLTNDSGRFPQWVATINYFLQSIDHVSGSGAGTYYLHGSVISLQRHLPIDTLWAFAHNDWLQIGFETGTAGFLSVALLACVMLFYSRKKPTVFASLCGLYVFGMFDMPLRYLPTAFLSAILLKSAFEPNDEIEEKYYEPI